ncbi:MAG: hypothetical protein JNJ57_17975 [Saprospiraceae bacterium]|nr:hypothetical protein [Saprospiraceae bacterium]
MMSFSNLPAQQTLSLLGGEQNSNELRGASINESDKYKIAKRVYDRLVATRGDFRYPAPRFIMSRATGDGALMNYDSSEIMLEERAYDVCAAFGERRDQALAIILGHELIHFYEKHGWRRSFSNQYLQLAIGSKLSSNHDFVTYETQADYLGGFLAYSAGFGLFDQCPELIANMYKAYNLPDTLPKYPSLQDRRSMSTFTIQKLELLVDVFDAANLLTAIGRYGEAKFYYKHILKDYQSREIFNNVGVLTLLEVLDNTEQKWLFPVELDLTIRASRGNDGFAQRRDQMLLDAIRHFDAALNMDPNYAPAYLNKACALTLLKEYNRAAYYAEIEATENARKHGYAKTESDASVLLGIIAYAKGDSITARKRFEAEAAKKNGHAEANLKKLLKLPDDESGFPPLSSLRKEAIDSISLASFAQDPKFDKNKKVKLEALFTFFQYTPPGKSSKILICRNDAGEETALTFFHMAKSGQTSKGVGIGATKQSILDAYKKPKKIVSTPRGEMLVYGSMIFVMDAEGKLEKWVNYLLP